MLGMTANFKESQIETKVIPAKNCFLIDGRQKVRQSARTPVLTKEMKNKNLKMIFVGRQEEGVDEGFITQSFVTSRGSLMSGGEISF